MVDIDLYVYLTISSQSFCVHRQTQCRNYFYGGRLTAKKGPQPVARMSLSTQANKVNIIIRFEIFGSCPFKNIYFLYVRVSTF